MNEGLRIMEGQQGVSGLLLNAYVQMELIVGGASTVDSSSSRASRFS